MVDINLKHAISCMGDSLSHNYTLSVPIDKLYPAALQTKLRAAGGKVSVRNFGRSGNTTTQMISRMPSMTQFAVPDIAVIFGGVNDPGATISSATTTSNIQSMIDTLTSAGCSKIIVMSAQFLNYTSGGDFDGSNNPLTDTACYYAAVIAAQKAAVAGRSGTVYADLYNFLRNRIINAQDTAKSASWHFNGTNQHFNSYGCDLVAQHVLATIQAQGWDAPLKQ